MPKICEFKESLEQTPSAFYSRWVPIIVDYSPLLVLLNNLAVVQTNTCSSKPAVR